MNKKEYGEVQRMHVPEVDCILDVYEGKAVLMNAYLFITKPDIQLSLQSLPLYFLQHGISRIVLILDEGDHTILKKKLESSFTSSGYYIFKGSKVWADLTDETYSLQLATDPSQKINFDMIRE